MAESQHLRLGELRGIEKLVGEVGELAPSATAWRGHALEGLIRLLNGQVGLTADIADARPDAMPRTLEPVETGWRDESCRRRFYEYCRSEIAEDPATIALLNAHRSTHFLTASRQQLVDDNGWYGSPIVSEARHVGDVDDFICSSLYWAPGWMHGFVVYRPWKAHRFGLRQRRIMRLFHLGVLRLYKVRSEHFQGQAMIRLPPRVSQTLELLLAGDGVKQIAAKLRISAYTVNDYTKTLYHRFDVTSRGQLISKCLSHRLPPPLALPAGMPPPPWPTAMSFNH